MKTSHNKEPSTKLAHYGVRGMRWGITKKSGSGKRKQASDDHANARVLKKQKTKNLTNDELKTLTKRLQLETSYKRLDPGVVEKGLKVVKDLTYAGTTVAALYAVSKTPLGMDVTKAVKSKVTKVVKG